VLREESSSVATGGRKITTRLSLPAGGLDAAPALVVLAHGQESGMEHPLLEAVAQTLAGGGFAVVRFNFPFREAGRKNPDPPPRLEACWLAVTDTLRERIEGRRIPLVVGGKSLGGRVAAQLVSDGVLAAAALVFLGYPLHRPGEEPDLHAAPLRGVTAPMLFVCGARDRMCRLELLERVLRAGRAPFTIRAVEGCEQRLEVPRRFAPEAAPAAFYGAIAADVLAWLRKTLRRRR